jgi:hypothetical protein
MITKDEKKTLVWAFYFNDVPGLKLSRWWQCIAEGQTEDFVKKGVNSMALPSCACSCTPCMVSWHPTSRAWISGLFLSSLNIICGK